METLYQGKRYCEGSGAQPREMFGGFHFSFSLYRLSIPDGNRDDSMPIDYRDRKGDSRTTEDH